VIIVFFSVSNVEFELWAEILPRVLR